MDWVKRIAMLGLALVALSPAAAIAQSKKQVPYWVSIAAKEALLRTGPGTNYPATWKYIRPGLPLRVIQLHEDWRKVEDPEGEQGWVKSILLSEQRTAIVVGEISPLRATPDAEGRIDWRVAPGVVGKISRCRDGWCELDVKGRTGRIETRHLWGVAEDEVVK